MTIFDLPARTWALIRKVEELLASQQKVQDSLEAVNARLRALENKMIQFEAEQDQLVTTAKAAAQCRGERGR